MAEASKFMFDLDFTAGRKRVLEEAPGLSAGGAPVEPVAPPPPPAPMFSEEELNLAREAAFDEGRGKGFTEGQEDAGLRIAQAIEALIASLPSLSQEQDRANEIILKDAVKLAIAVVKRALPAMAETHAFDEVSKVVADLVPHLLDEPRIIVRVALPLVESIRAHLEQLANQAGFEGRIVVQEDERVALGDCKLEWADGGGERDLGRLMADMDQIVERALASAGQS